MHSGHLAYIRAAKKLGDKLIVAANSDAWLARKKGAAFMCERERCEVLRNIVGVDFVITFDDSDNSAKHAIWMVRASYPQDRIVFANGGDRTKENIPEMDTDDNNIEFVFGVGGEDKKNSSSNILQQWAAPRTDKPWGHYRVLHSVPGCKVKELTVLPGQSLSMQRHFERNEYWLVTQGRCVINGAMPSGYQLLPRTLTVHQDTKIPVGEWHQLTNPFDEPCRIVEIQYGHDCREEDIVRQ